MRVWIIVVIYGPGWLTSSTHHHCKPRIRDNVVKSIQKALPWYARGGALWHYGRVAGCGSGASRLCVGKCMA